jgi:ABC-2 type transport system ATP-binding protein
MHPIEVLHIAKSFGETQAIKDVSFEVKAGEIFGLLGPNGAGKTTAIRIMLDIFKPDKGSVSILGGAMTEEKKAKIGYMPEDRGLYQDAQLERCLLYLASLKDMPENTARSQLTTYLERFNLLEHKNKKIKELSKGMQQKAQIIATLLHKPELIIIDEPFTALDPLNVQLVKDLILELRQQGVTIIMSTHQMHQVEELCDRIVLINEGRDVLYERLDHIQRQFMGHEVLVRTQDDIPNLKGIEHITTHNGATKITLEAATNPQDILHQLINQNVVVEKFEIAIPSLDEIFIQVVEQQGKRS